MSAIPDLGEFADTYVKDYRIKLIYMAENSVSSTLPYLYWQAIWNSLRRPLQSEYSRELKDLLFERLDE